MDRDYCSTGVNTSRLINSAKKPMNFKTCDTHLSGFNHSNLDARVNADMIADSLL